MKRGLLTLIMVLFFGLSFSQNWLGGYGGTANDEALAIAKDASGNIYTTGYFTKNAVFGNSLLNSNGAGDVFVMKQNSAGQVQWAVKSGGIQSDRGTGVAVDAAGNVFITGHFRGTAHFGGHTVTAPTNTQHIFVAKLDNAGNFIWVQSFGGNNLSVSYGVTADSQGNVIFTGQFKGSFIAGVNTFQSAVNPNNNQDTYDIYLAKLNGTGSLLWAKQGNAKYNDRGISLAVDNNDHIYLTGQYSDTLTMNNVYPFTGLNASFLMKFSPAGGELWLKKFLAPLVVLYDMKFSGNHIYITGDYRGQLSIENGNGWSTVNATNTNKVFAVKISTSGVVNNTYTHSSIGAFSSRAIDVDATGNVYLAGFFSCSHTDYSAIYGQGTFFSAGFRDIFITRLNSTLQFELSRQFGGPENDYCSAMVVLGTNNPVIAGSFEQHLNAPDGGNFIYSPLHNNISYTGANNALNYCGDNNYGSFVSIMATGQKDVLVAAPFDPSRSPYDYFNRQGATGCVLPIVTPEINASDSIVVCDDITLKVNTNTGQNASIGPGYNFLWSNGSGSQSIHVSQTGTYSVTVSTEDGCRTYTDQVHVEIVIPSTQPVIHHVGGVREQAIPVMGCMDKLMIHTGDTALLYATGFSSPGYNYGWSTLWGFVASDSIYVTQPGLYNFQVTAPGGACPVGACIRVLATDTNLCNQQCVGVNLYLTDPLFQAVDTVTVCQDEHFGMAISDSLHLYMYNSPTYIENFAYWTIVNGGMAFDPVQSFPVTYGFHKQNFKALSSGLCTVEAYMNNPLTGTQNLFLTKTFYLNVIPFPVNNPSVSGPAYICVGDTVLITVNAGGNYSVTGPGIIWMSQNQDSILVNLPGVYSVSSTIINQYGCETTASAGLNLQAAPSPPITMNPSHGVICPGDSVQLSAVSGGNYSWVGPTGINFATTQTIYASVPGYYHYVFDDPQGCQMVSEFVEVLEYSTPFLLADPGTTLCAGPITISVESLGTPNIQWHSPLSGSSPTQVVTSPGVYSCDVEFCGITTTTSIEIHSSGNFAQISPIGSVEVCQGDSLMLQGNPGMIEYVWMPGNGDDSYFFVSQPGVYTFQVTDENGCVDSDTIEIFQLPSPVVPLLVHSPPMVCAGTQVQIIANGNGETVYWIDDFNSVVPIHVGDTLTVVASHTQPYYFYTDNGICNSEKVEAEVLVNPVSLMPEISGDTIYCTGDEILLSVPTYQNATYQWTIYSGQGSTTNTVGFPYALPVHSGIYSVVISDGQCTSPVASVSVWVAPIPNPQISSSVASICVGNSATLSVNQSYSHYLWSPSGDTTVQLTVNSGGTYSLQVTDQYGCVGTSNTLTVQTTPGPSVPQVQSTAICAGNSATLTANGNWQIDWFVFDTLHTTGSNFFSGQLFDTLYVSVIQIDTSGCVSDTVNISIDVVPPGIVPLVSGDLSVCENSAILLELANAPGNADVYWYQGANLISNQNPLTIPSATLTDTGQYSVYFTLQNCYSGQAYFNVVVNSLPNQMTLNHPSAVCEGDEFIGFITNPQNGVDYTWIISPSNYTVIGDTLVIAGITPNISISVIADLNGCTITQQLVFNILPSPQGYISSPAYACIADSIKLDFTPFNTNSNYTYNWSGPLNYQSTQQTNYIFPATPSRAGVYTLIVNEGSCSTTFTIHVQVSPFPVSNLSADTTICMGDSPTISVTPGYSYYWSTGDLGNSTVVSDSGYYWVQIVNGNVCMIIDSIYVNVIDCDLQNIPNVFTPNGDGVNDVFYFYSENYKIIEVNILNRWGQLIYSYQRPEDGWTGHDFKGMPVPEGTYYYVVKHINYKGDEETITGAVSLMR